MQTVVPFGTIEFKMLAGEQSKAAKVANDAGLGPPRRIFRQAGKYEGKHAAFGLDLWYAAEPDSSSRRLAQGELHAAAVAALAKINIASSARASMRSSTDDRVPVESAAHRPVHTLFGAPNDPDYGRQDHYSSIGMEEAWSTTGGRSSVVVAVVDTGMDMDHADLTNLWVNAGEVCGDGVDNDNNGYVDDCHGNSPTHLHSLNRIGHPSPAAPPLMVFDFDPCRSGYNFADDLGGLQLEGIGSHGTHGAGIVGAVREWASNT